MYELIRVGKSTYYINCPAKMGFYVDDGGAYLIDSGNVGGGMIPKLQNCVDAIEGGVSRVHILDGRIKHCLLLEIFTDKGIGTAILRKDGIQYYDVQ